MTRWLFQFSVFKVSKETIPVFTFSFTIGGRAANETNRASYQRAAEEAIRFSFFLPNVLCRNESDHFTFELNADSFSENECFRMLEMAETDAHLSRVSSLASRVLDGTARILSRATGTLVLLIFMAVL